MTPFSGVYDGRCTVASSIAGYLTNLEEVQVAAGVGREGSAAEAAHALIQRHGVEAVSLLRGAFALAVWHESERRGVLATDHLGARSLFYRAEGQRLFFATEIRDLLDLLTTTPPPDDSSLISWLAYDGAEPGYTLYSDIRRLRPGELIELGTTSFRVRTYWRPRYTAPTHRSEYVDVVRDTASAAVQRRLDATRETGILLSGGIDSSSVAAFAKGRAVRGYSAVFPDHPEMDESPLIDQVAEAFALPLAKLEVRGGSMLASSLDYLATWRLPSVSPNLLFLRPLAQAAANDGVAVLLDGEGGDELFNPSPYVFADLVMRGRLRAAVRLAERIPGVAAHSRPKVFRWLLREWALKGAMPHVAHSLLRRTRPSHYGARWLTEPAAVRHGRSADPWAWKELDGPRWWANLAYDFTEARVQLGAHDFLRHKSALAGVDGRHPYLEDVDLVLQMLAIPSEASFDDNLDRPLLRRAVTGLVPDDVRLRTEKSYFDALFESVLTSTDRDALLELLAEGAHVGRYVQVDLLRSWLLGTVARPANWRWVVWRAATAECWLRTLEDAAFPAEAAARWQGAQPRLQLRKPQAAAL